LSCNLNRKKLRPRPVQRESEKALVRGRKSKSLQMGKVATSFGRGAGKGKKKGKKTGKRNKRGGGKSLDENGVSTQL